jgi:hypothetical protein
MATKAKRPAKKASAKKTAKTATRKTAAAAPALSAKQASRIIKKYAEDQKIQVELTPEQLDALMGRWNDMDPTKPAQVTFVVKGKPISAFAVAAYRYRGDTCCV